MFLKFLKFYLFLFILTPLSLFSQNWINSAGGNFNDESYDVEVDAQGNIYTTGYVTGNSVFSSTLNLQTNGYSDIYVSKSDANGNFLWVKVFGGPLADRGYDLALDANGNIYVTGYFIGTAFFDTISLTAAGSSQDIFVLKLDNNGNVLWVKNEGGPEGDTGYGISVDNSGNVICTGQFKGTATISPNVFTSAIDPNTNQYAYDLFVSKYDANGNALWSLQGIAEYDDRGMAVTTDVNDNIYLCGQFSDTLIFAGNQHNNTIYNAGLLVKLDPNGNEIWFKRLGAYQTLIYDIELDSQGDIVITGDFKGQMVVLSNPNIFYLNGNYDYRIFVMKFQPSGDVVWGVEDDSDSEVSSKAIAIDNNDDIYIAGTFKCVFDEYADTLGSGLFNSVGFTDVFITKYNSLGVRQWMKQYGGPLEDYCSGIAVKQVDNPIISGSYNEYFNYPYGINFNDFSGINHNFPPYYWNVQCNTNGYKYLNAVGARDIFVGKPIDLSLDHYYYYGMVQCFEEFNPPCIGYNCEDTLVFCGGGQISIYSHTVGNGEHYKDYNTYQFNPHHGPYYDYLWNTNDTTPYINVNNSGYYSVNSKRIDNCLNETDSVYVIINPIPNLPLLSDDHSFNTLNPAPYNDIILCYPDTANIWFNNLDTSYQFSVELINNIIITDTLVHSLYQAGYYNVKVVDTNGCFNDALFLLTYIYNSKDTMVPYVIAPSDTVCLGQQVCYIIADSLTNPNGNYSPFCDSTILSPNLQCLNFCFTPLATGWYPINHKIILGYNNMCGTDTTSYHVIDSIYVVVNPKPTPPSFSVSGDSLLCPGDTVNVWTDTIIPGFTWSGTSIVYINNNGDSIYANQQGAYGYGGVIIDSLTGCSTYVAESFNINVKPSPVITSNSPDNIICPYDSIQLTCQVGAAYDWIGPQGNVIGNTQSIWVSTPGFYHCVYTDFTGCVLTSNTIELKEYSSPFLVADPGNELCHTGTITLTVYHSGNPSFNWWPPVNSTSSSITVNQPGTYVCEITQCGFTVIDSIVITSTELNAIITPLTDTIICVGDTAILMANSGMIGYEWGPSIAYGQINYVTDSGYYYVTITDQTGCTATSDSIYIGFHPGSTPPTIQNQTVCLGDTVTLINSNGNNTYWFSSQNASVPFYTGDTLIIYNLQNDTTVYVQSADSVCSSNKIPVTISISPASINPVINGDTLVCSGNAIALSTTSFSNTNYNWTGPNNSSSNTNTFNINNVDTTYSGYYYLSINDNNCSSGLDSVYVEVLPLPIVNVIQDTILKCQGDSVTIYATGNYTSINWVMYGYTTDTIQAYYPGFYFAMVMDSNGCSNTSDSILVLNYPTYNLNINDTTICYGDSVEIGVGHSTLINWYDSTQTFIITDSTYQTGALFSNATYYYNFIDTNGCLSPIESVTINVTPANGSPNIYGDSIICEGDMLMLTTNSFTNATYTWQNSSGNVVSTNQNLIINPVTFADSGTYTLTVNGVSCIYSQSTIHISVEPKPTPPVVVGDSVICFGDTIMLVNTNNNYTTYWTDIFGNVVYSDTFYIYSVMYFQGNFNVTAYNTISNGCTSDSTIFNFEVLSAPLPYIYSNNVCEGDTLILYTTNYPNTSYSWQGPGGLNSDSSVFIIPNIQSGQSGVYSLLVTDTVSGCSNTDSILINVGVYPVFDLGNDTTMCEDSTLILTLPNGYQNYEWMDSIYTQSLAIQQSGTYYATIYDGYCSNSDTITVTFIPCKIGQSPNVFTPNGDGINDYFVIKNAELYPDNKLMIYNRWGKLIYETTNYKNDWDGSDKEEGTYYYIFIPSTVDSSIPSQKGYVTILR